MSDTFPPRPLLRDDVAELTAAVVRPDFATQLLSYIRSAAEIANFGTFYVPDMTRPAPVLSIWAGEMSSYWFNHNAKTILKDDRLMQSILKRIQAAQGGGLVVERWRPAKDDPISPIYARDQVIERVTVSSYNENVGFQSFFLRGAKSGWLSDQDMQRLEGVLPLAHELIGLRHRIAGVTAFSRSANRRVSTLREQGTAPFGALTPREAETCDLAVQGMSVAGTGLELGVSENTVRTLRRRAYSKLGVNSSTQIVTMTLSAIG